MPEISKTHMGGTMRLGLRPTVFDPSTETWSKAHKLYGGAGKVWERHRHRYEVNPEYIERLQASGLMFTGKDEKGERMQILELPGLFRSSLSNRRVGLLTTRSPFLPWAAGAS
jgi:CTP synthase